MSLKSRTILSGFMPLANTDQVLSAHIGISYHTLTTPSLPRIYSKLYVRVGDMVVWIALPREVLPLHMYRVMLIVLLALPTSLRLSLSAPDVATLSIWVSRSFRKISRKYMRKDWYSLMRRTMSSVASLYILNPRFVSGATYTPDALDTLCRLSLAFMKSTAFSMSLREIYKESMKKTMSN